MKQVKESFKGVIIISLPLSLVKAKCNQTKLSIIWANLNSDEADKSAVQVNQSWVSY